MRLAVGCFLTILSGLSIGLCRASALRRRVEALSDFLQTVELLRTEISFSARPLSDCLCGLSGSVLCRTACAEDGVQQNPRAALERAATLCFQNREDCALALEFAAAVGSSDTQSQLRTLDYFAARIRHQLHTAEQECKQKSKLSVYLGLCTALAVCILFG